jgi:phage FluMu protein Com
MNEAATIPDERIRCPRCGATPAFQSATELRPGVQYLTLRCPCCAIIYDAQVPFTPVTAQTSQDRASAG